ncbi:MAG: hypothetical protein ABIE94_04940 [archaeon]
MRNIRRKGQMEMMGLAVIVVLVAIIMLFFISFKVNQVGSEPEPQKEYADTQLATNYILAALKTTTECRGLNVQELLQDCALRGEVDCTGWSSCDFVYATLDDLTAQSLDFWGTEYIFTVKHGTVGYNKSTGNCDKFTPAEATGFQPISLYPDSSTPIITTLRVCRQ